MSVVHDVEGRDLLYCSKAGDPIISEPGTDNTEVGDSWPFSATEKFGDGDLLSGDPLCLRG